MSRSLFKGCYLNYDPMFSGPDIASAAARICTMLFPFPHMPLHIPAQIILKRTAEEPVHLFLHMADFKGRAKRRKKPVAHLEGPAQIENSVRCKVWMLEVA